MKFIVSFSGGKDSTAMLIRLLEEGRQVDEIVFFNTGWEYPQTTEHVAEVEKYIGRKITTLHPAETFDFMLCSIPVKRKKTGKVYRHGRGWPSHDRRWCTSQKKNAIKKHFKSLGEIKIYIGIAADEASRVKDQIYPLVEWGMTEADCLKYCYARGFRWGGLYEDFERVSCFCCPLRGLKDYKKLRDSYSALWDRMLDMGSRIETEIGKRFFHGKTIQELDARLEREARYGKKSSAAQVRQRIAASLKAKEKREARKRGKEINQGVLF